MEQYLFNKDSIRSSRDKQLQKRNNNDSKTSIKNT